MPGRGLDWGRRRRRRRKRIWTQDRMTQKTNGFNKLRNMVKRRERKTGIDGELP